MVVSPSREQLGLVFNPEKLVFVEASSSLLVRVGPFLKRENCCTLSTVISHHLTIVDCKEIFSPVIFHLVFSLNLHFES